MDTHGSEGTFVATYPGNHDRQRIDHRRESRRLRNSTRATTAPFRREVRSAIYPVAYARPTFNKEARIMSDKESGGGVGFLGLLTILFVGLKLTDHIDWSWWWVISPLWIFWLVVLVVAAINSSNS
jgi:hypothetical protein